MTDHSVFRVNKSTISLLKGDITLQDTDVIVNAANSGLMGGGGVDGAIHRAGGPAILEECKAIVAAHGRLPTGQAVITSGGRMKTRHVIHTVGPVWHGGGRGEPDLLASAWRESLKLAAAQGLRSISFPSISTGVYGYPVEKAAKAAVQTVIDFLTGDDRVKEIVFVLFNDEAYNAYQAALDESLPH